VTTSASARLADCPGRKCKHSLGTRTWYYFSNKIRGKSKISHELETGTTSTLAPSADNIGKLYQSSSKSDKIGIGRKCRYESLAKRLVPQGLPRVSCPADGLRLRGLADEFLFSSEGWPVLQLHTVMARRRLRGRHGAAAAGSAPLRRKLQFRQRVGLDGPGPCARWHLPCGGAAGGV